MRNIRKTELDKPPTEKNFLSTATLRCNLFVFPFYHHNLIFTHYFCRGILLRTHFFTAVFPAINHCFEEAVVVTGEEFSIIHIFITFFANDVYFKVSIMILISFFFVKNETRYLKIIFLIFFPFLILDLLVGNTNGHLGATSKIFVFHIKKSMTVWVQFSKFCISL